MARNRTAGVDGIGDIKADDPDPVRKQQAKASLDDLSTTAQRLLEESDFDVAWVEKSDMGSGRRALVIAPLSVAGTLANRLYEDRTVVATSATLTLGGRFDTVARSLGLPAPAAPPAQRTGSCPTVSGDGWSSLDVGSPFDYPRQGILYVAAHLPRPAMSGFRPRGNRRAMRHIPLVKYRSSAEG